MKYFLIIFFVYSYSGGSAIVPQPYATLDDCKKAAQEIQAYSSYTSGYAWNKDNQYKTIETVLCVEHP